MPDLPHDAAGQPRIGLLACAGQQIIPIKKEQAMQRLTRDEHLLEPAPM